MATASTLSLDVIEGDDVITNPEISDDVIFSGHKTGIAADKALTFKLIPGGKDQTTPETPPYFTTIATRSGDSWQVSLTPDQFAKFGNGSYTASISDPASGTGAIRFFQVDHNDPNQPDPTDPPASTFLTFDAVEGDNIVTQAELVDGVVLHGETRDVPEGTALNLYVKHVNETQVVYHPVVHNGAWSINLSADALHGGDYDSTIEYATTPLQDTKHHFTVLPNSTPDVFAYESTGLGSHLFGVVDLTTGVFTPRGDMGQTLNGIGSYNGTVYGGLRFGNILYSINTSTGALTTKGTGSISYGDFGSTTSGLYGFGSDSYLYSINPHTGAATKIGPTGVPFGGVFGMSSGGDTLYVTHDDDLYSLNTATGAGTLIGTATGPIGFGAEVSVGGVLYGGGYNGASTPKIYTLDPHTGAATFLSASPSTPFTPSVAGFWGLAPISTPPTGESIQAGDGAHQLIQLGDDANDTLIGGAGAHDTLIAGDGDNDLLKAGSGSHQLLHAGDGAGDTLEGGTGAHDTLIAGEGDKDVLQAGSGSHQSLQAGDGSGDTLIGGRGAWDILTAGDGAEDSMQAGSGADQLLKAGDGEGDTLIGGSGAHDTIKAGDGAEDSLKIRDIPMTLALDLVVEDELAKALNLKNTTLQRWRAQEKGPAWLAIGRRIYYRRSEIDRWLKDECERPTARQASHQASSETGVQRSIASQHCGAVTKTANGSI